MEEELPRSSPSQWDFLKDEFHSIAVAHSGNVEDHTKFYSINDLKCNWVFIFYEGTSYFSSASQSIDPAHTLL